MLTSAQMCQTILHFSERYERGRVRATADVHVLRALRVIAGDLKRMRGSEESEDTKMYLPIFP